MLTITVGPELEEEIRAIARRSGVDAEEAGRVLLAAEVRRQAMATILPGIAPTSRVPDQTLFAAMRIPGATPMPDDADVRELAYEGVGA